MGWDGTEVKVESQSTSTEPVDPRSLLWAIAEFRDEIDRLIDEQKALVLSRRIESPPPEPPSVFPAPTLAPTIAPAPATEAEPTVARKPVNAPPSPSRSWQRETPPASITTPPTEAVEAVAAEPARPEDARQRLDALAAKLLDRRLKQNLADPSAKRPEK